MLIYLNNSKIPFLVIDKDNKMIQPNEWQRISLNLNDVIENKITINLINNYSNIYNNYYFNKISNKPIIRNIYYSNENQKERIIEETDIKEKNEAVSLINGSIVFTSYLNDNNGGGEQMQM